MPHPITLADIESVRQAAVEVLTAPIAAERRAATAALDMALTADLVLTLADAYLARPEPIADLTAAARDLHALADEIEQAGINHLGQAARVAVTLVGDCLVRTGPASFALGAGHEVDMAITWGDNPLAAVQWTTSAPGVLDIISDDRFVAQGVAHDRGLATVIVVASIAFGGDVLSASTIVRIEVVDEQQITSLAEPIVHASDADEDEDEDEDEDDYVTVPV